MSNAASQSHAGEFPSDLWLRSLALDPRTIKLQGSADRFWYNERQRLPQSRLEELLCQISCMGGVAALLSGYYLAFRLLVA
jgi:hypothetical protein